MVCREEISGEDVAIGDKRPHLLLIELGEEFLVGNRAVGGEGLFPLKIELMSRLESRMEVVQGVHRQLEKVKKENGRLEKRLRQVEEENRALQDKLAALETENAEVAEKKPIIKTESNSRSDCCKEACASLRALVESFKEERAQMLLQSQEQEELVRQNDLSELTRRGELQSGAVRLKDQRGRGWVFGSARLIFFATLVVVVAFAYLHIHRLTLGRATNFPM